MHDRSEKLALLCLGLLLVGCGSGDLTKMVGDGGTPSGKGGGGGGGNNTGGTMGMNNTGGGGMGMVGPPVVLPDPPALKPECPPRLTPQRAILAATAASGSFDVAVPAGCTFEVRTALDWIKLGGTTSGKDSGKVTFQLTANAGPDRMGVIVVGEESFVVVQRGTGTNTGHPRLWIRAADLDRLRSWAVSSNPMWTQVIQPLATKANMRYQALFPGGSAVGNFPSDETDATMIFAFLSLVAPDPAARADATTKARNLFIKTMEVLDAGPSKDPKWALSDNFRYSGERWALIADWLYLTFSAQERDLVRRVLLRLAEHHAAHGATLRTRGKLNDPSLLADTGSLRWTANNWTEAMARNMLLEGLVFDDAHDPPVNAGQPPEALKNSLRAYREEAIKGMLYMQYAFFNQGGDGAGGTAPEGPFGYGAEATAFLFHGLLALLTSAHLDWEKLGEQVSAPGNRYLRDIVRYAVHAIASKPTGGRDSAYLGAMIEQINGNGAEGFLTVSQLAPVGIIADLTGDVILRDRVRWILTEALPGGTALRETHAKYAATHAILSFLLHDPRLPAPRDFRTDLPRTFFAPPTGRVSSRTSWDGDASWLHWTCSWKSIDHQIESCGSFAFFRKGEWLTDPRNGYSQTGIIDSPDYWNVMGINKGKTVTTGDSLIWDRGGETRYNTGSPKTIVSEEPEFLFVEGDATNLHNREQIREVKLYQRALVWLRPDVVVLYDRASTVSDGRWKRFWMNFPSKPTITGKTVRAQTSSGQGVRLDTVLPASAVVSEKPWESDKNLAPGEQMNAHVMVEDPSSPADLRLLHVLQGFDKGGREIVPQAVTATGPMFHGVNVANVVVMFPVAAGAQNGDGLSYSVPTGVTLHVVTGLSPGAKYDATVAAGRLTLKSGGALTADAGGVLTVRMK